jgi:hypothetical protein
VPQPTTTPTAPSTSADRQIERAKGLERERAALQEKISKNRDYLRLMSANDELDANQKRWLNTFYPLKERGDRRSEEEIEATRKVRKAARDEGRQSQDGGAPS